MALSSFHILLHNRKFATVVILLVPERVFGDIISPLRVMDKTAYPYETDDTNLYGLLTVPLPYPKFCPGFSETTGRTPREEFTKSLYRPKSE